MVFLSLISLAIAVLLCEVVLPERTISSNSVFEDLFDNTLAVNG